MSIALHTVFLLNENIKWLEEYIIYYINLGISHFYLYDNEGSIGIAGSNKEKNKYGFPAKINSDEKDRVEFAKLLVKYDKYITHVLWQPRNENNQIIYAQEKAIDDCIEKYGDLHTWICFVDLDEFIFSPTDINLSEYLNNLPREVSAVRLLQKKFLDRFLSEKQYITQEYGCIDNLDTKLWAPKYIVRCKDYLGCKSPHYLEVTNKTVRIDKEILRFNHYNVNDIQLKWMKRFFRAETPFKINAIDEGMKRYHFLFK